MNLFVRTVCLCGTTCFNLVMWKSPFSKHLHYNKAKFIFKYSSSNLAQDSS